MSISPKSVSVFLLLLPLFAWSDSKFSESSLIATYIYKISQFTDWPEKSFESESDNFNIAIVSDGSISNIYKKMAVKQVHGRKINVRIFDSNVPFSTLSEFHVVFLYGLSTNRLISINKSIEKLPILTFSENENLDDSLTIITFVKRNKKIRFAIDRDQAKNVGIKFSSKLLRIAVN